jgi:hypothetical protein
LGKAKANTNDRHCLSPLLAYLSPMAKGNNSQKKEVKKKKKEKPKVAPGRKS